MQNIKKQFIDNQVKAFKENEPTDIGMINKHHIVLRMIQKYSTFDSHILDIGCSDGKILKALEQNGYKHLYGIDLQEAAVDSIQEFDVF